MKDQQRENALVMAWMSGEPENWDPYRNMPEDVKATLSEREIAQLVRNRKGKPA